ncbi:MAG: Oxygen-independent coproporphyrinogen III oxidase [Candidatus Tokpelaia hoelldobleri]|uniref:Heme chaperone HemW n=1 Tax=Candidatus Tokpelaia hoelldobleri TaxID=1902579 RepID=A0A1U9JWW6_9HYPH|nr:MAG: Oxygen-independent coproporphyrinogen III oxidase [Candidatus Tokpelaia hoelldoblerii]
MATAEPFGIYIHWPFCAAKCPYCDFNSHVRRDGIDEPRFVAAFLREMETVRARTGARRVTSVFIGGGTPSLMQPQTVAALLDGVARLWPLAAQAEITMEANPSSVEADRFRGYRAAGFNRLSLGVQALDDGELKRLGRVHDVRQARYAIELARAIFPRLSFDLIYARPGQAEAAWRQELNAAIDLAADHLSLYQLTIEEGTAFHRLYAAGRLQLPEPELAAALYDMTQDVTQARGLPAYEISNHAQAGAQSQHNLLYWRYQQYAGIGPGAHGRFLEAENHGRRSVTITERLPERWLERVETTGHGIVAEEWLTPAEQADEMALMGLRLYEGLDVAAYERLAARPLSATAMAALQRQGLVEMAGNSRLRATAQGRIVLDYIITELVS